MALRVNQSLRPRKTTTSRKDSGLKMSKYSAVTGLLSKKALRNL